MTTIAQRAVDAAMEVECKKDRLQQNQDGTWKFTLTVAPDGLPDPMLKAPPGTRYTAVFVEVDDVEQPVKHASAAPEKPKKPFKDYRLSQQAGMRCQDEQFREFLEQQYGEPIAVGDSATVVRRVCCLGYSRAKLDTNVVYAKAWRSLNAEYETWAGLQADER